MFTKKVIEYFNNEDRREIEDLVSQIDDGAYEEELSEFSSKEVKSLMGALTENNTLSSKQKNMLNKINHIGAFIILAFDEI